MGLCKICFQEVQNGIVIPGYQQASGVVHEECLAGAVFKVTEDPQKEGLLRYLIDYEEKHAPHDWSREVSGQSADGMSRYEITVAVQQGGHRIIAGGMG